MQARYFGAYADAWLPQRISSKGEPLRPRTYAEYRRQLDKGLKEFKSDQLGNITGARVRAWHLKRMKEAGATTAAREAALLRAIMASAVGDDLLDRNPVDSKLTRSSTGQAHRPPTLAELGLILREMESSAPRLKLAVLLAAYGGLRISEWRALRRSDITFDDARASLSRLLLAMGAEAAAFSAINRALLAEGVSVMILLPRLLRTADPTRKIDFQVSFGLSNMSIPNDLGDIALRTTYLVDGDPEGDRKIRRLSKAGTPAVNLLQMPTRSRQPCDGRHDS